MPLGLSTCEEHDCVVVYSGRTCPVCEMKEQTDEDIDRINDLKDSLADAESRIADLEAELADRDTPEPTPIQKDSRLFRQDD